MRHEADAVELAGDLHVSDAPEIVTESRATAPSAA